MKKNFRGGTIALGASLCCLFIAAGFGNPVQEDPLRVEIAQDKNTFVFGDDIKIKVRIVNTLKEECEIRWSKGCSQMQFIVFENDEEIAHLYSYGYSTNSPMVVPRPRDRDRPVPLKLKSGESIERVLSIVGDTPFRALSTDTINIGENNYPALFPYDTLRKGKYRIKVIFSEDKYQALSYASSKYKLKARYDPGHVWAGLSTKNKREMPVFESNEIAFTVSQRGGEKGESSSSDYTGIDAREYEAFLWKGSDSRWTLFYQRRYPDPYLSNIPPDPWLDDFVPFTQIADMKDTCRFLRSDRGKEFAMRFADPHREDDLQSIEPCWIIWQDGEEVRCALVQRKVLGQLPLGNARETIDIVVNNDRSLTVLVREKEQYACHIVKGWDEKTQTAMEMKTERVAIAVDPHTIANPSLKEEEGQVYFISTEGGKSTRIPIGPKVKPPEDRETPPPAEDEGK